MRLAHAAPAAIAALVMTLGPHVLGQDEQGAPAQERPVEATSLLGEPLHRPEPAEAFGQEQRTELATLRRAIADGSDDEMTWVWVGRRLAYLGQYREAIEHYTEALEKFPDSYKLLRHRGHRYITIREFEKAEADLWRAAQLAAPHPDAPEPDGIPNERNEPRSTTNSNIWYHLALSRYLQGEYAEAAHAWEWCLRFSKNDDMIVSARYWLFLSRLREGREWDELEQILLPIDEDMDIVENHGYHRLLLLFLGQRLEEDLMEGLEPGGVEHATIAYGVARARALEGDEAGCRELLAEIVEGEMWPAFGHIAADADLAKLERDG